MPNESIHPEKLLLLVAAIPTLRLEVNQFGERRRRFEEQIRNLQALRKSPSEVHNKASIDQQTADLQRRRAEIESEFSAAFDAFNDAGKLAENCRQYLQKQDIPLPESQPAGSSSQLPQMSARSPTTKGKEELATVRSKIVEIVDMVDALKSCPPPAAVLIEKQIAAIDNVQHRLFIDDLVTRGDTTSILIAIHAAELKQALTTYIKNTVGKDGITDVDRSARLAELDTKRVELERHEEMLCLQIEAAGALVHRRRDFPPSVFFEVQLNNAALATGTQG